jgi:crotonobetainyl-CoA:carnitine CoA-transferase CaiB-like acyl-CoA transferase
MGGALRVTGEPGLPPVKEAARCLHLPRAYGGGIRALWRRIMRAARMASGQHVDVSIQQVAFSRNFNGILVWQFDSASWRASAARWLMARRR